MWGAKGAKDDEEEEKDGNMMFKPVRPRRERLEEDAADEKENSGTKEEAMAETRRRRVEEEKKEEDAPIGWMTSPNKRNNRNKLKIEEDEAEAESMTATKNNKHFGDDQFDDGIMLIPDLDEDGGEVEVDNNVAQAPRHVPRKIPTLEELEEAMKTTVPVIDGNYDLGVLTRTLVPLDSVQEKDETWDFDSLLREVTEELTNTPKTIVSATISTTAVEKGGNSSKNSKKSKGKSSKK